MTGVGDDSRGQSVGRPWLIMGVVLAVGSTLALVLTNDLRWLKLGIVAALWAALIGAFVAARYRKQAAATEESAAQAQEIYELELEREIAARREFELEVEADTRQQVEEEAREELEALRAEVTALRESLQALFGGEVLWERVALTAQSTRMRSIGEEPRLVTAAEPNGKAPAQITTAKKAAEGTDRPTELIGKIRDLDDAAAARARRKPPAPQEPAPGQFVPRPSRPHEDSRPSVRPVERQPDPPTRRVRPAEGSGRVAASVAEAASRARAERSRPQQAPAEQPAPPPAKPVQPRPAQPAERAGHTPAPPSRPARQPAPSEPTRPAMEHVARGRPASSVAPPSRQQGAPEPPTTYTHSVDPDRAPGWERPGDQRPEPSARPEPTRAETRRAERPVRPAQPGRPAPPSVGERAPRAETPERPEPAQRPDPVQRPEPRFDSAGSAGSHRKPEQPAEPNPEPEAAPQPNPTLPPAIRDLQGRPGGRRRKPESDDDAAHSAPASASGGGGRRHRPEGEPPPWESLAAGSGASGNGSRHSTGESNGSGGRRRAPEPADEPAEPRGSHAEGRSVSELLAAHGAGGSVPRRRRRADD
ncbi:DUF6779 domain-containing protein [Prauserella muralis]|uniref:Uncharacterized protein n=1 Tax=Prauserella muralis TaxID=588067 RepID=A0A2V4B7C8_9PSEU|nr:DUF6779 domain-containing protein [Prauserella muralis]PXY31168.1 hypothetical protein BAY60_01785 [Prauserella muralis]TWE14537.1 hypothetical protein FHX69_6690 [Prauserella muralis]